MIQSLLNLPLPILAAAIVPQAAPELLDQGPGWLATLLLGGWIVLWFLDRVGKLPGRPSGERRSASFSAEDRAMLKKLYELFAFRDDQDGIERFLRYLQDARKSHTDVSHLVELQKESNELARKIADEIARSAR